MGAFNPPIAFASLALSRCHVFHKDSVSHSPAIVAAPVDASPGVPHLHATRRRPLTGDLVPRARSVDPESSVAPFFLRRAVGPSTAPSSSRAPEAPRPPNVAMIAASHPRRRRPRRAHLPPLLPPSAARPSSLHAAPPPPPPPSLAAPRASAEDGGSRHRRHRVRRQEARRVLLADGRVRVLTRRHLRSPRHAPGDARRRQVLRLGHHERRHRMVRGRQGVHRRGEPRGRAISNPWDEEYKGTLVKSRVTTTSAWRTRSTRFPRVRDPRS